MIFRLLTCGMMLTAATVAHGGLFDRKPACGEASCVPEISRPCRPNVMSHQRQSAVCLPACCPIGCAESPSCCAPAGPDCCAQTITGCVVTGPACCAPVACQPGQLCQADSVGRCAVEGCDYDSCCNREGCCCAGERCDVGKLIHQSMTACYARQRRNAVHHLSDYYELCCHPQIMDALVYALNDSDERVRAKAADEIGDQIRRNGCCCINGDVICVLRYSLGDCDKHVRRQAEEALQLCGYRIVDGRCCCPPGPACETPASLKAPVPVPDDGGGPIPIPPQNDTQLESIPAK